MLDQSGAVAEPVHVPGVVVDTIPHAVADPAEVAAGSPSDPAPSPSAPAAAQEQAAPAAKKAAPVQRGGGMAVGGRPVEAPGPPPATPTWPAPRSADELYVPEEFDVTDLSAVNRELNQARARLFRVSGALKVAQRTLAEAQADYDRAMRRQLVTISGGTAETRKAIAEINCEHFENRIIVGKQIVEEWKKRAVDCRDDLKAVENIAHNVRAQMDIR